jgi:uncharacterized membrane protein
MRELLKVRLDFNLYSIVVCELASAASPPTGPAPNSDVGISVSKSCAVPSSYPFFCGGAGGVAGRAYCGGGFTLACLLLVAGLDGRCAGGGDLLMICLWLLNELYPRNFLCVNEDAFKVP